MAKYSDLFVAIDVETTGFSPILNELIEISAIKYNGREKLETFTTLIKPENPIPLNITVLTGISNGNGSKCSKSARSNA